MYFNVRKYSLYQSFAKGGRRGCYRMVVGLATTYAIIAYQH